MSPNPPRYPQNWADISLSIRTEANWTCQACGLVCRRTNEPWAKFCKRMGWHSSDPTRKRGHYVLTVAHLDQDPQNCDRANLKALCSVCHLRYDSRFRGTQKRLIAEYHGQQRLDYSSQEGLQLSLLPGQIAPFLLPFQGEAPTEGRLLSPPVSNAKSRPEQVAAEPSKPQKRRRHTPKGSASGWIEERQGNRKRSKSTVSYYYRWDEPGERGTVYLPVAIAATVKRMVEVERQPVSKVLEFIQARKNG